MSAHILMHGSAIDQRSIWLLAGTGDGPRLAQVLQQHGWRVHVSVVTPAAAKAYQSISLAGLAIGSLGDPSGITAVLEQQGPFRWVIDATHPFAVRVSADLATVCRSRGQSLLRFERPEEPLGQAVLLTDASCLQHEALDGVKLLLAIGGRRLAEFVALAEAQGAAAYARCLPSPEGLRAALATGLPPDHLAVLRPLQGNVPGSIERALCRTWGITAVLCRQSGGVSERLWHQITTELGLKLWLMRRPSPPAEVECVRDDASLIDRIRLG